MEIEQGQLPGHPLAPVDGGPAEPVQKTGCDNFVPGSPAESPSHIVDSSSKRKLPGEFLVGKRRNQRSVWTYTDSSEDSDDFQPDGQSYCILKSFLNVVYRHMQGCLI